MGESRDTRPRPAALPDSNIDGKRLAHDTVAERAVLALAITSPEAREHVVRTLRQDHMYVPAHGWILAAIDELHRQGSAVDEVTVSVWLNTKGHEDTIKIQMIRGIVDEITSLGVTNVEAYCATILDKWKIREIASTCHRMASEAYGDVGVVEQWASRLQGKVTEIVGVGRKGNVERIKPVVARIFQRQQELNERGARTTGVPTYYKAIDKCLNGMQPGHVTYIAARPGVGKAQPIDAKILTPTGWTTMGALSVGDMVIGADGKSHPVTGVFDRGELDVFKVTMSDGTSTECCDDHLWYTRTRKDRLAGTRGSVKPLREIRNTMRRCDGGLNHSIPYMKAAELEPVGPLPLHPNLLGLFLGEGNVTGDNVKSELVALGLMGLRSHEKFIPEVYLTASIEDRLAILRGLCDADGYVTSPRLRDGIEFLVGSLGGRVAWTTKKTHYTLDGRRVACKDAYRMHISFPACISDEIGTMLPAERWAGCSGRLLERFIKSVEPADRKPCRCIAVDSEDHLYVTDGFIVTHNTALARNIALKVASNANWSVYPEEIGVLFIQLEGTREDVAEGLLCSEARVDHTKMRAGMLQPADYDALTQAAVAICDLPIWVEDSPATIDGIIATIRRVQQECDSPADPAEEYPARRLGVVVVDYVQRIKVDDQRAKRNEALGLVSRRLQEEVAKGCNVHVLALAAMNRNIEQRKGSQEPQLSDIRDCGDLESDADAVFFMDRWQGKGDQEPPRRGKAASAGEETDDLDPGVVRFTLKKNRHGPSEVKFRMRFAGPTRTFFDVEYQ